MVEAQHIVTCNFVNEEKMGLTVFAEFLAADVAKRIKLECEEKLAVAMPAMNAAISALNTLRQQDITFVKAMQNPPHGIKITMEAICILKVSCGMSLNKSINFWFYFILLQKFQRSFFIHGSFELASAASAANFSACAENCSEISFPSSH